MLVMPEKMTWEWLAARLPALNANWLEGRAGLRRGRISDTKRGKSSLSPDELERIRVAILQLCPEDLRAGLSSPDLERLRSAIYELQQLDPNTQNSKLKK